MLGCYIYRQLKNRVSSMLCFGLAATFFFIVKLWLVSVQGMSVAGGALHDEHLFVRSAFWILSGEWLGPYDELTLIKGPFYPIWIAGTNILGLSLHFSQHLLYFFASIVLTLSLRPVISGWKALLFVYVVLLFNPMSFSGEIMPRVIREGIYPALSMLTIAGSIGFYLRALSKSYKLWPWVLVSSISLPCFWLTREEGIWILPGVLFLNLCAAYLLLRTTCAQKSFYCLKIFFYLAAPFMALFISIHAISLLNERNYGVYKVIEIKSEPFTSAYGALSRVKHSDSGRYRVVPLEVRYLLYNKAHSFYQIKKYLDGEVGERWIQMLCSPVSLMGEVESGTEMFHYIDLIDLACKDIAGGWFIWAFRESVAAAGYHQTARDAEKYYKVLAGEINTLCDDKGLNCLQPRNTLTPIFCISDMKSLFLSMVRATGNLLSFRSFTPKPLTSKGSDEHQYFFSVLANDKIICPDADSSLFSESFRMHIMQALGFVYQNVVKIFFWPTVIISIMVFLFSKKDFYFWSMFTVMLSLASVIAFRILMLSYIDVYSFPALSSQYLSPLFPLAIFIFLIMLWSISIRIGWMGGGCDANRIDDK